MCKGKKGETVFGNWIKPIIANQGVLGLDSKN
jgi:hypothetical protein